MNSRLPLVILCLVFLLPVAAAYLVLNQGWYRGGSTNHGVLLERLDYQTLAQANPAERHWQLLTLVPEACGARCEDRLTALQQIHLALGRERPRVVPVLLLQGEQSDATRLLSGRGFATAVAGQEAIDLLERYPLVIVDPLGQWVMGYAATADQAQQIAQGRALLTDLRKLLKLSHIG
ncbi:hypothetical protein FCL40_15520 [Ferrimonas sediminicola]|uniref:Cytochrome oxidase Cu insertion factor, SCO1/SenC/PrrC family n=1 Tax=Ferrimonas sediminicola TaxID=2569538 RepID=A0A4U1B9Z5_9GAMM|nr:hypothetical protein [Ferrimonas sediminicola]TKB47619.1 hypothetical protein FCL40_15520 [Ferrimonas sediminicola]